MKKIISTYIIVVAISGIIFILGFIWLVYNISDSMAGEKPLLSYVFGINMYIFGGLLILGLVGVIVYLVDKVFKYISKNR